MTVQILSSGPIPDTVVVNVSPGIKFVFGTLITRVLNFLTAMPSIFTVIGIFEINEGGIVSPFANRRSSHCPSLIGAIILRVATPVP